ncbi:MAG: signal peptide peptidase SppA [Planctomycetaceae bacterium]
MSLRNAVVVTVLAAVTVSGTAVAAPKPANPQPAAIAVFRLGGVVTEGPGGGDPLSFLTGQAPSTLRSLVNRLHRATDDKAIAAVALLIEGATLGSAQLEEVIVAVDRVRSVGKPVYLLAETLGTAGYVLASHASHISVVPGGEVALTGLASEAPYIRGLLDLLGVQPDFLTCGEFKSAGEMFMRTGPSPNAAAMSDWLLDSQFQTYVDLIATGRDVDHRHVHRWIDRGPYTAERALKRKLIDAVEHRREFYARLHGAHGAGAALVTRYGLPKRQQIDLSSPLGLLQLYSQLLQGPRRAVNRGDTIAIVYLQGTIVSGSLPVNPLGGAAATADALRKALATVEKDDAVKAVVLRIDSPGGSALASEVILDAARRVQARKPLIVSMGNVAASGGYYVACRADAIFADPTTVTGSIGVVGGKFATTGLWDKIGVKWSTRSRGANATLNGSARIFSEKERDQVQDLMDEIYETFKDHVVAGRGKKLKKKIDDLAGGRVYTGRQALALGLVDQLGGLNSALADAAGRAGLKAYGVREYPESRGLMDSLLGGSGVRLPERISRVGSSGPGVGLLDHVAPLLSSLDPRRAAAIRRVVGHLERLQHERVFLLGPEIRIHDGQ